MLAALNGVLGTAWRKPTTASHTDDAALAGQPEPQAMLPMPGATGKVLLRSMACA